MLLGILGSFAVIALVGGWIFFMVTKKGWSWAQIIAGVLLCVAINGTIPGFADTTYKSVQNVVNVFDK